MNKGDKSESFLYVSIITAITVLLIIINQSFAAQQYDTVTISVNVSQLTLVDINPANLSWGAGSTTLNPGSVGTDAEEENNYENIWIENIGSTNITQIWFNNSYESTLPFGTGNPDNYDPANMVVISNGSTPYQFINRVEYNETDPMYVTLPSSWDEFGRLRNASQEWWWAVDGTSSTDCSAGTIYISTSAKTQTDTGDTDLTDNGITLTDIGSEGHAVATIGGEKYCVIVPQNCQYVMFTRWNADKMTQTGSPCATDSDLKGGYLLNSTTNTLVPGGVKKAWVHVHVPYGVPYGVIGSTQSRRLTVIVSNSYAN